jgi:SAM-dependent methyltransferase
MSAEETLKQRQRAMWASGDFPRVSRETVAGLGPQLVEACEVRPGQRVLDVAAGTGNAAIPAAELGADVVACDLTPELFDAGRAEAAARGVQLAWAEADAEALPFADGEFDVVLSCMGAMFAPDHQAVADELVRVCRPGGTIGMINAAPGGWLAAFFKVLSAYAPQPPQARPPILWGDVAHLGELFGDRVDLGTPSALTLDIANFRDAADLCAYYKAHFGPVIAAYANVAGEPERTEALDRDLLDWAERMNREKPAGSAVFRFEYLLVVARRSPPGVVVGPPAG